MPLRIRIPALSLISLVGINKIKYGSFTPNRFYYSTNLVSKMYLGNNLIFG